jgi:hypothetical protein
MLYTPVVLCVASIHISLIPHLSRRRRRCYIGRRLNRSEAGCWRRSSCCSWLSGRSDVTKLVATEAVVASRVAAVAVA